MIFSNRSKQNTWDLEKTTLHKISLQDKRSCQLVSNGSNHLYDFDTSILTDSSTENGEIECKLVWVVWILQNESTFTFKNDFIVIITKLVCIYFKFIEILWIEHYGFALVATIQYIFSPYSFRNFVDNWNHLKIQAYFEWLLSHEIHLVDDRLLW